VPLHGRVIGEVIKRTGAYLIPRGFRQFQKYDKQLYRQAFGPTGGRAVRHGRDAGLAIGGSLRSTLEIGEVQPRISTPSYKQPQARRGRGNKYGYQRRVKYFPCRCNGQSGYRRSKPSYRRM